MKHPPIRTEAAKSLDHWFLMRHNSISSAIDENTNVARDYLRRQLAELDAVWDEVMSRLASIEQDAITTALPGVTYPEAERMLEAGEAR